MPIDLDSLRVEVLPTEQTDASTDITTDLGGGMVVRLVRTTEAGPEALASTAVDLPGESLLKIGVGTTIRAELEGIDVRPHNLGEHRFLGAAVDGSPYVSSLLISPRPPFGLEGVDDLLVASPRRSLVICRPMERNFPDPCATLERLAATVFREAADPCTPHVFWWREGALHRIHVDHEAKHVTVAPEVADRVGSLPRQI
ncbi:hypothetical protein [Pseudactinotalea sp.]|uniref:hypothetical protein n=1 Tax=Pseudactinotalea sp. TaxID=1926260 RepID=UPI003B3AB337